MANLNALTNKIMEDAEIKSKSIIAEARNEEKDIIDKMIEKANKQKLNLIEKAHSEAKMKKERILSNANLNVRNSILESKQNLIDKVFHDAYENLKSMPYDKYELFVKNYILSMDIDGDEEIIQCQDDKNKITEKTLNEINEELRKMNKKGELILSSQDREIDGGFILYKNGIEVNCTFKTLVFSLRDELESEVINALFG